MFFWFFLILFIKHSAVQIRGRSETVVDEIAGNEVENLENNNNNNIGASSDNDLSKEEDPSYEPAGTLHSIFI